jgi:hypothetical protein
VSQSIQSLGKDCFNLIVHFSKRFVESSLMGHR